MNSKEACIWLTFWRKNSLFIGALLEECTVAGKRAVIPTIKGSGYVTQYCEIAVDPKDPFPNGYTVGDIW